MLCHSNRADGEVIEKSVLSGKKQLEVCLNEQGYLSIRTVTKKKKRKKEHLYQHS